MQKENETRLRDQVRIEKKNLIPTLATLKHIKQWVTIHTIYLVYCQGATKAGHFKNFT